MASDDPFISRQDVTDLFGRDVTTDPGGLIAVDAACATVRLFTERNINQVIGGTVTLDGTGTDCLVLPEAPVTQAGTVLVAGTAVTDYVLATDPPRLIRRGTAATSWNWPGGRYPDAPVWPAGRQNVQVTYDHGWPSAEIPRSIRAVALAVAMRVVVQGVAVQETVGDAQIRYAGPALDLTAGEKAILRKYRNARSR